MEYAGEEAPSCRAGSCCEIFEAVGRDISIALFAALDAFRLERLWPIRVIETRVNDPLFKIYPDALVVSAIIATAGNRPMHVHRAAFLLLIQMLAVAICPTRDDIRRGEIPVYDAFFHVLL